MASRYESFCVDDVIVEGKKTIIEVDGELLAGKVFPDFVQYFTQLAATSLEKLQCYQEKSREYLTAREEERKKQQDMQAKNDTKADFRFFVPAIKNGPTPDAVPMSPMLTG